ncbi:hypothetical protein MNBD_ALPHA11-646 [hydrothermal vent metagenome]|uniref:Lipopolysaccharide assembly protein A domain-containing protein n=1 Tax=hydrothermal vent metagenome TaxID=652676 RepID=A0A3B0ULH4_9ZZZZ
MVKKRLVAWLVLIPFCILLVLFTLANRQTVIVQFDPFVSDPAILPALEVPMFVVIYFMLILGVVLGGMATWFAQSGQRRQKRQWRSKAKQLQNQQELQKQSSEQNSQLNQQQAIL